MASPSRPLHTLVGRLRFFFEDRLLLRPRPIHRSLFDFVNQTVSNTNGANEYPLTNEETFAKQYYSIFEGVQYNQLDSNDESKTALLRRVVLPYLSPAERSHLFRIEEEKVDGPKSHTDYYNKQNSKHRKRNRQFNVYSRLRDHLITNELQPSPITAQIINLFLNDPHFLLFHLLLTDFVTWAGCTRYIAFLSNISNNRHSSAQLKQFAKLASESKNSKMLMLNAKNAMAENSKKINQLIYQIENLTTKDATTNNDWDNKNGFSGINTNTNYLVFNDPNLAAPLGQAAQRFPNAKLVYINELVDGPLNNSLSSRISNVAELSNDNVDAIDRDSVLAKLQQLKQIRLDDVGQLYRMIKVVLE